MANYPFGRGGIMVGAVGWILPVFAGCIWAVSWLDGRFWLCAWMGLVLFFAAISESSLRRAFTQGYLFGVFALALPFLWVPRMLAYTLACEPGDFKTLVLFSAIISWEAIPFVLLAGFTSLVKRGSAPNWIAPCAWITLEAFWPRVFPWSLAHSQTGFTVLLQIAELGGTAAVSFLIIAICLSVARLFMSRHTFSRWATLWPIAFLISTLAFGIWRPTSLKYRWENRDTFRVGVAQVDPAFNDSTQKMRAATQHADGAVDLWAWPESTLGTYATSIVGLDEIQRDIRIVREPFVNVDPAKGLKTWLLVGGKSFSADFKENVYCQTAFLIDPQGRFQARYHKRRLLPIGEYIPWEETFPGLHDWAELSEYIESGDSDDPVRVGDVAVGVLICYEDIVPDLARRTTARGAEVLISLINASAFESPLALELHLRLAILRAIENRRALVRCAGTGVSCCVSPLGAVSQRLPINTEAEFVAEIPLLDELTVYTRLGHWLPHACLAALLSWIGCQAFRSLDPIPETTTD